MCLFDVPLIFLFDSWRSSKLWCRDAGSPSLPCHVQCVASKVAMESEQKVMHERFPWARAGHIPLVRTLPLSAPNCRRAWWMLSCSVPGGKRICFEESFSVLTQLMSEKKSPHVNFMLFTFYFLSLTKWSSGFGWLYQNMFIWESERILQTTLFPRSCLDYPQGSLWLPLCRLIWFCSIPSVTPCS